jgi:predicted RNA-binding protein (virulence factor B family)
VTASHVASDFVPLLGRTQRLRVVRSGPPGAFLAVHDDDSGDGAPVVLLPNNELENAPKIEPGLELEVFVYLDSDDRPIATLKRPLFTLGEVAFARVAAITAVGAFVDWGLAKQLLVPHAEQTKAIRTGERHPIGLYVDRSHRLAGTMRVTEMLRERPAFDEGQWVEGEAWRKEPRLGVFVIVEKRSVGLVPDSEPNRLQRGEKRKFRVANVLDDGKVELSLRAIASQALEGDGELILDVLARAPDLRVGDHSPPGDIQAHFGLSKKAFKRAVGGLLKRGAVRMDDDGFVVVSAGRRAEG